MLVDPGYKGGTEVLNGAAARAWGAVVRAGSAVAAEAARRV